MGGVTWAPGSERQMDAGGRVLVVMAKHPVPGAVKTRLGRRMGDEPACALYAAFLEDVAARFTHGPWALVWAVHPPGADLSPFIGTGARCIDQEGADLGERMLWCFRSLLGDDVRQVVMLGADAPHLPRKAVRAAFAGLAEHDVTIVPTRDGGYCLIGLRVPHDLFTGIAMGTPAVFAETRARARSLGLRMLVLEETFDVDEADDLDALERLIATGEVQLPRTAAALHRWRAALLRCRS